jgi:F-type H+-transporting ATPase subunit alpha
LFNQIQYNPLPVEVQVVVLWAGQNGFVDDVPVAKIKDFQHKLTDFMTTRKMELMARIAKEKELKDATVNDLKAAVTEFKQTYK